MLSWALAFFIVSIIAAVLGFGSVIEREAANAAWRFAFLVFLVGFVVALLMGLFPPRRKPW